MYTMTNEGGVAELTWQGYISFNFLFELTTFANFYLKVDSK